jgi:RES domain-containing protein
MAALAEALVRVLTLSSSQSKEGAMLNIVAAISCLAEEPAPRQLLGQQPALVGALVALLPSSSSTGTTATTTTTSSSSSSSSGSSDVQQQAVRALGKLAWDEGLALRIVGEPWAMPRLLALLQSSTGTEEDEQAAVSAIEAIMRHAACRHACAEHIADLAAALVHVMEGGSDGSSSNSSTSTSQKDAAGAISWLAHEPAARQVLVQQPGLVRALVALLRSTSSSSSSSSSDANMQAAHRYASFAIANLAQEPGSRPLLVQEPHLVGRLVALLTSSSDHTRLCAAQALHNLAAEQKAMELFADMRDVVEGVLPLPAGANDVLEVAAAAVLKIASTAASSSSMALPQGLVASLACGAGDGQHPQPCIRLRRCAVESVATLSAAASSMPVLVQEQGLISQLVAALGDSSQEVQLAAGRALRNLATDAASAQTMVGMPGVVPGLVALLTSPKGVAASQAALVLCNMMRAAPGCCAAVAQEPGLLPGLRHVMRSESSTYAAVVCACGAVRALEAGQPEVSGDTEGRGNTSLQAKLCVLLGTQHLTLWVGCMD